MNYLTSDNLPSQTCPRRTSRNVFEAKCTAREWPSACMCVCACARAPTQVLPSGSGVFGPLPHLFPLLQPYCLTNNPSPEWRHESSDTESFKMCRNRWGMSRVSRTLSPFFSSLFLSSSLATVFFPRRPEEYLFLMSSSVCNAPTL